VADICESLLKRGFDNEIEDTSAQLKSLIVVKENVEVLEMPPEEFFQQELSGSLFTVIPVDENETVDGLEDAINEDTESED